MFWNVSNNEPLTSYIVWRKQSKERKKWNGKTHGTRLNKEMLEENKKEN